MGRKTIKQICVGSCPERKQNYILSVNAVHQQPIRYNMVFRKHHIFYQQIMITIPFVRLA